MSGILIVHQFENMIINVLGCTLTLLFYMCPQLWKYFCLGYKLDPVSSERYVTTLPTWTRTQQTNKHNTSSPSKGFVYSCHLMPLQTNNHIARLRAQNPLLTFSMYCSHLFVLRTCPHACSIVMFNVESKLRGGKPHAHPSYDHWYILLHSDIYFTRISSFHVCLLFPVSWREWDISIAFYLQRMCWKLRRIQWRRVARSIHLMPHREIGPYYSTSEQLQ